MFFSPPPAEVTIWNGTGEAEALSELFVDNLGSLLGTTTACVHQIGYAIVGRNEDLAAGDYGLQIAKVPMSGPKRLQERETMGNPFKCGRLNNN